MHPLHKFRFCPGCGSDKFAENDETSKKCVQCGFTYYFNPRAANVALILNERGELLVARRAHDPAKGTLDLPGGFGECFETAEEGVVREVMEETGLEVDSVNYLFSLPNIYPFSGMDIHTLDMFFECKVTSFEVQAMDDVQSLQWMPVKSINVEEFGLRSIRAGLEKWLKNSRYLDKK